MLSVSLSLLSLCVLWGSSGSGTQDQDLNRTLIHNQDHNRTLIQEQNLNRTLNQVHNETQTQDQNRTLNQVHNETQTQDQDQNRTLNQVHNETQTQDQNRTLNQVHNETQDQDQNLNRTLDQVHNETQDQDQDQNRTLNQVHNETQDQDQNRTLNQVHNETQDQDQNLNRTLDQVHNETQDQDQDQNRTLNQVHNETQDQDQDQDQTLQHQTFSGLFGSSHLSGIRVFGPKPVLESRIIGGLESWSHSWPWQVSLRFRSTPACGGAVLAPRWVVSAAHCFKRYNKASFWTVLAGKHDLDDPLEPGQQLVGVSRIFSYRDYDPRTKDGDLALLRLDRSLVFNRFVRPIDVWMSPLDPLRTCSITGWGSTRENGARVNRLQEVNVTILPPEVCSRFYPGRIKPSMFCAGKFGGGADACQGDSGGPLSCYTGSRYELAGLVSWGVGCGRARRPGVYTRVQVHTHWMRTTMEQQNLTETEEPDTEEDRCGVQQSSRCRRPPGSAGLVVAQDGEVFVGNVSESCPWSWSWMVSLQAAGRHYCSGVLVHNRWVLTARHCNVRAREDLVLLGLHDLRFSASQSVLVDEVLDLPGDGDFPPSGDLSLLRLRVPARLTSNVSPVCVPDEDEDLDHSWSCVTTGWGSTKATGDLDPNRLHQAVLNLVNSTSCQESWGRGLVTDAHICTDPAGSASCMGDSGAPLVCRKRGVYFLFGVLTWGSRRCHAHKPAVFSRVPEHHWWISEITHDL